MWPQAPLRQFLKGWGCWDTGPVLLVNTTTDGPIGAAEITLVPVEEQLLSFSGAVSFRRHFTSSVKPLPSLAPVFLEGGPKKLAKT